MTINQQPIPAHPAPLNTNSLHDHAASARSGLKGAWQSLLAVILVIVTGFGTGCAGPMKMAPSSKDKTLTLNRNGLALLSLKIDHAQRPSSTPTAERIFLTKEDGKRKLIAFIFDSDSRQKGKSYLLRMPLEPGTYQINSIYGLNGVAFLCQGTYFLPVLQSFEVKSGQVCYIGRIDATTRERKEGEFRAGPLLPLLDQSAMGWSGSTWEVLLRDGSAEDLPRFLNRFPSLSSASIETNILPPFERTKAQNAWDNNDINYLK